MDDINDLIVAQANLYNTLRDAYKTYKSQKKFSIGQIDSKLLLLDGYWQKYQDNDHNIYDQKEEEHKNFTYFTDDKYTLLKVEELYATIRGEFFDARRQLEQQEISSSSRSNIPAAPVSEEATNKLPPLPIPKFDGNVKEWLRFRTLFYDMVVTSNRTDSAKLAYLLNSLSGEPLSLIQTCNVSAGKFESDVWGALTKFYNNNKRIISAYAESLLNLKPMKMESVAGIQTLISEVTNDVESLRGLGAKVEHWNYILVPIIINKVDSETRLQWENKTSDSTEPATYQELLQFLQQRLTALTALSSIQTTSRHHFKDSGRKFSASAHVAHVNDNSGNKPNFKCFICNDSHYISSCNKFKSSSTAERLNFVKVNKLCFNCLGKHLFRDCKTQKVCLTCNKRHHTLLHEALATSIHHITPATPVETASSDQLQYSESTSFASNSCQASLQSSAATNTSIALLGTAMIVVESHGLGQPLQVRGLIDPGSEVSLVAESLVQKLHLPRHHVAIPITGVGSIQSSSKGVTKLNISSCVDHDINYTVEALILSRLTSYVPKASSCLSDWAHLSHLRLADPNFASSIPVEVILGVDIFSQLILPGLVKGKPENPIAQQTTLGWILMGNSHSMVNESINIHHITSLSASLSDRLDKILQTFWEVESVPFSKDQIILSPDEQYCEEHFKDTHSRDSSGRFIVRLPFKTSNPQFSGSLDIAKKFHKRLEYKLSKDDVMAPKYSEFLHEFQDLKHLDVIGLLSSFNADPHSYVIPHHGILNGSKFRSVFNGSVKDYNSVSLNDMLHTGPSLQCNIIFVIIRWRMFKFAYTADVAKMYRQILIHPEDRAYQRILWRFNPDEDVSVCNRNTVTYGLGPSAYLAIRCLRQLAADEASNFPIAAQVILNNMYVDDCLFVTDSIDEAVCVAKELVNLLQSAGFPLRKWLSNHPDLLSHIPAEWLQSTTDDSQLLCGKHKLLGLVWHPNVDTLSFSLDCESSQDSKVTKRLVLSTISKLFDPLGLLAPIIIRCKIFMRRLWLEKLDWDQEIPDQLKDDWYSLLKQLHSVSQVSIPRWVNPYQGSVIEIHGFSDASIEAIAASVYIRIVSESESQVNLLVSKTKVAPVKTLSIPRLELCAAHLLSKLVHNLISEMQFDQCPIHLWADSQVALSWITSSPHLWQTFVSHRITDIQNLCPTAQWHFIEGPINPADIASRGMIINELKESRLWWNGPLFLSSGSDLVLPRNEKFSTSEEIERKRATHHINVQAPQTWELLNRFSSHVRLLRITAWCNRFISILKEKVKKRVNPFSDDILQASELQQADIFWIKHEQGVWFKSELKKLKKDTPIDKTSKILKLDPFLDKENQCIRVGGRLKFSKLSQDAKCPFIIPDKSYLSTLIISAYHHRNLHSGTQLTLSLIRERYWIINARLSIKNYIHKCIRCIRYRPSTLSQKMGNLPSARVTPSSVFTHVGVDYAGPIKMRAAAGRGRVSYPGYIAVFVCFSTKAVHLEAVTSYDTPHFMAALKRMISRRGMCTDIYSDQGTNFVGASNVLHQMFKKGSAQMNSIQHQLANVGITWHFNPPGAPHMGGLWEAAVKSCKFHIKRVVGESTLTYEEMSTLLASIEACMNSRPICAISDDPSDNCILTPAHFLTGRAMVCLPETSVLDVNIPPSKRWLLLNQMRDRFWVTWRQVYLQQLQTRVKWQTPQRNISVGDLVLVKSENTTPAQWPLAIVIALHHGQDGLVRSVRVKTSTTQLSRPVVKLILLPVT